MLNNIREYAIPVLYREQYNFKIWKGYPKCCFMLSSIPRSGSTYFSLALWRTGLLGAPMEYFNFKDRDGMIKHRGGGDVEKYLDYILRYRTSPNGVFGYKIFIPNLQFMADNCPEILPKITPDQVIYLTRKDKIAQAISYAKATQTNAWFHDVEYHVKPEYDKELIDKMIYWIDLQENSWEKFFEIKKVSPIRVFYEDVIHDEVGVINSILKCMKVDGKAATRVSLPVLTPQADEVNLNWIERYLQDCSQHPDVAPLEPDCTERVIT